MQAAHVCKEQLLKYIRIDMNRTGTVDPSDLFVQCTKRTASAQKAKGVPRRFVSGNTAFRAMNALPLLRKDEMIRIAPDARERIFRGVSPSDKYNPRLTKTPKAEEKADDDDENIEEPEEADPEGGAAEVDKDGSVPAFWMEIRPKARDGLRHVLQHRGLSP